MHMADALLSPAVGGTMWVLSAGAIAYCSAKVRRDMDDRKIPLMGVLGAFLFAAQMINFTIPATGSSGHLGGGLLLAILLGPHAAFLTIASVLMVQALFFADGGLLALGCNIFNLGIFPAFIAYPLLYKKIVGNQPTQARISTGAIVAGVAGLQLGALAVVLETVLSGISSLPFTAFALLMQTIHLGIGIVEGIVTAAIVAFVYKARPEIMSSSQQLLPTGKFPVRRIAIAFFVLFLFTGGFVSWFASENPDGLEWSIKQVTGKEEPEGAGSGIHAALAALQERIAFLPDYAFKKPKATGEPVLRGKTGGVTGTGEESAVAKARAGTTVAGLVGGLLTLGIALLLGLVLKRISHRRSE